MARNKPGKWSNVPIPDEPDEVSEWFTQVLKEIDARKSVTIKDLALEYRKREEILAALRKAEKRQTAIVEALDRRILEELDKFGSDVWRDEYHTFSPSSDVTAKVKDKQAFLAWIHAKKLDDLLTVMPGTIKTLAKEALDPDVVATLTPAQLMTLQPGDPGSLAPPPGIDAFKRKTLGRRKR